MYTREMIRCSYCIFAVTYSVWLCLEVAEQEVRVRFSGFCHDEDEWVNARNGVRERSIPLVASECHKVKAGDLVLCYRANEDHALYSDAHVVKIERQLHDDANCTCTFVVRFQYDNAE
ncbi:protein SAWADEE homeodomain homolog 1, partial [Tanacetum coccineum]